MISIAISFLAGCCLAGMFRYKVKADKLQVYADELESLIHYMTEHKVRIAGFTLTPYTVNSVLGQCRMRVQEISDAVQKRSTEKVPVHKEAEDSEGVRKQNSEGKETPKEEEKKEIGSRSSVRFEDGSLPDSMWMEGVDFFAEKDGEKYILYFENHIAKWRKIGELHHAS